MPQCRQCSQHFPAGIPDEEGRVGICAEIHVAYNEQNAALLQELFDNACPCRQCGLHIPALSGSARKLQVCIKCQTFGERFNHKYQQFVSNPAVHSSSAGASSSIVASTTSAAPLDSFDRTDGPSARAFRLQHRTRKGFANFACRPPTPQAQSSLPKITASLLGPPAKNKASSSALPPPISPAPTSTSPTQVVLLLTPYVLSKKKATKLQTLGNVTRKAEQNRLFEGALFDLLMTFNKLQWLSKSGHRLGLTNEEVEWKFNLNNFCCEIDFLTVVEVIAEHLPYPIYAPAFPGLPYPKHASPQAKAKIDAQNKARKPEDVLLLHLDLVIDMEAYHSRTAMINDDHDDDDDQSYSDFGFKRSASCENDDNKRIKLQPHSDAFTSNGDGSSSVTSLMSNSPLVINPAFTGRPLLQDFTSIVLGNKEQIYRPLSIGDFHTPLSGDFVAYEYDKNPSTLATSILREGAMKIITGSHKLQGQLRIALGVGFEMGHSQQVRNALLRGKNLQRFDRTSFICRRFHSFPRSLATLWKEETYQELISMDDIDDKPACIDDVLFNPENAHKAQEEQLKAEAVDIGRLSALLELFQAVLTSKGMLSQQLVILPLYILMEYIPPHETNTSDGIQSKFYPGLTRFGQAFAIQEVLAPKSIIDISLLTQQELVDLPFGETITAFCHWIYEATNSTVVVDGIKGAAMPEKPGLPPKFAIAGAHLHYETLAGTSAWSTPSTNQGTKAISEFQRTHVCGSFCKNLELAEISKFSAQHETNAKLIAVELDEFDAFFDIPGTIANSSLGSVASTQSRQVSPALPGIQSSTPLSPPNHNYATRKSNLTLYAPIENPERITGVPTEKNDQGSG